MYTGTIKGKSNSRFSSENEEHPYLVQKLSSFAHFLQNPEHFIWNKIIKKVEILKWKIVMPGMYMYNYYNNLFVQKYRSKTYT